MNTLTLRQPDDWHVHLRDGSLLQVVAPATARQFGRAIVMPNLRPPVTSTAAALAYRERILAALGQGEDGALAAAFTPLMTAYLTETSDPDRPGTGPCRGRADRRQAVSGRRHHQLGRRCA